MENKKTILGLDLGTNSIGWALVDTQNSKILGMGSRIIPMGTDKQDYEKGVGITKNADRRTKRTIRKMNKRYKLRRNKLLYILHEMGMLSEQFQFKNGIPEPNKIQDLELLPIKKGALQLDSLAHYELRANAINCVVDLKDLGKILYQFNQLRGYAGGGNDNNEQEKKEDNTDEDATVKRYEVRTQKAVITKVEKSNTTFKVKGGANKGQELPKYNITVSLDEEELDGQTELQNLAEKIGKEEELEIRIKRNKKGETTTVTFALPQKTNWRKQMEKFEKELTESGNYVSQELVKILQNNKWEKVRNRVVLRHRYQQEFDKIWETQSKAYSFLKNCPQERLEKMVSYIFPGKSESQHKLRKEALAGGLKHLIRNQVIYYQRPLKLQADLISKCQFEKEETVLANSHPLFQEFRCWDQINRLYITSKQEVWNEKKKKTTLQYTNRFLTNEEKQELHRKLLNQKQVGFSEVAKIVKLKNDKTEYLNGLNAKAKLKGCDTLKSIKDKLGEYFEVLHKKDNEIATKIWKVIFDNANNGSEYDPTSPKVTAIAAALKPLDNEALAIECSLKLAQSIKFPRKYASLSEKAIRNILPLMQLNPSHVTERVKQTFNLIQTGEITDDFTIGKLEDYVIDFVEKNPNALEMGGLMYAFASSLVYGKHTKETIKPQIKDYHHIQYVERNLRNPIVSQLANETMQIIKALWKQYRFNPEELEIRVELARELKNSAAEREKIFKSQIKSQKINEAIKKRLIELKQEPNQGNIELYKLWSTQSKIEYPAPKKVNEPTQEEIQKLRLWEEQGCISPYTLKSIPLSKLFSPDRLYDIDHIIPKSRYFDDSLANKVVCETSINEEKSNRTAWEYITQQNSLLGICSEADYVQHVDKIFYGRKKRNLLLEKIPTNPVDRQMKDTQYISVAVKDELAKIVGSHNVKTSTGEVTSFLRSRWGLRDLLMKLTRDRFKHMEWWDINPETGAPHEEWVKMEFDKTKNKKVLRIKNWSKRYDHRHHAIDALTVALTEQSHIQRLNNLNKYLQDELTARQDKFKLEVKEGETLLEVFFNLEEAKRVKIQKDIESSRHFEMPFDDLVEQAKTHLEAMTISVKPKDALGISMDKPDKNTPHKQLKPQVKIRSALHKEMNYGKTKDPNTGLLRDTKTIDLSKLTAKDISQIVDEVLRAEIDAHKKKYESMKEAFTGEGLKAFNQSRFQRKKPTELKPPVYKVKTWYSAKEDEESTLQRLYDDNEKLSVVTGENYLFLILEKEDKNGKERLFDLVSLFDAAAIANDALRQNHMDFKQKIIATQLEKTHQELKVELINRQIDLEKKQATAKGVRKNTFSEQIEKIDVNFKLKVLFTLQKNDLVYLPEGEEDPIPNLNNHDFSEWLSHTENKKRLNSRVYKLVKFDKSKIAHFIPHNYASVITAPKDLTESQKEALKKQYADRKIPKSELNFVEYGSYRDCSPYESGEAFVKSVTETDKQKKKEQKLIKIQDKCIKLQIDWLGNTKLVNP